MTEIVVSKQNERKNLKNLSVVWISRISDSEDTLLKSFFEQYDLHYDYERIIVGHTNLDPTKYNFKYVPFWENGLDKMALLGLKKNLAVFNASKEYSLVLHADTFPTNNLFERMFSISLSDMDVVAPIGYIKYPWADFGLSRGLTWADTSDRDNREKYDYWKERNLLFNLDVRHKIPNEPISQWTYISGAAIFSKTSTFQKIGWNNGLGHVQGEDVEYSHRLKASGYKLSCDPSLEVYMHNAT